ncbi:multiubiquitin domain-containing protein [Albibacterium indicum]|uniref:multiubiquitin domain-containing protein n=1 Tax=Albibacterium indicum TaxID=2292082 RepID=UPI000E54F33B|nr:multiubiquitin domain-containing protein [Pedobacter indicus]
MKNLKLIIEDQQFEWSQQYITGLEVKEKVGAPPESDLFLAIKEPWEDEPISNETDVNLARPGIEKFFFKNAYYFTLNEEKYRSFRTKVTGTELLNIVGIVDTRCYSLYQKLKGCDFEKVSPDDTINLSNPGIERFITKDADTFVYTVDGEHEMTDKKQLSANDILLKADIDPNSHYLVLRTTNDEIDYAWNPDESIKMDCKGMEFESRVWEKLINIEEYGKVCRSVPPARSYQIKIDKQYHIIHGRYISQEKLIELGGKPNVKYDVYKFLSKNPKPVKIAIGEKVDLLELCLVRFVLQPKEQTEGMGVRKQFLLPAEDVETLKKMGLEWETITLGAHWVIIYDYPIPEGYNIRKADVALMIPPTYPATQIDMAYFYPALSKSNNRRIGAITNQGIDGRTFQRWSRHRQAGQWTPGVDCIATHLCLVDNWLINDLKK